MVWKRVSQVTRLAVRQWFEDGCSRFAAAISYYAIFSLFPLGLLCITAVGAIIGDGETAREKFVESVGGTSAARDLLDQTLRGLQQHQHARGVGAVVGAVTLAAGASGVFSELDDAIGIIFRCPRAARQKGRLRAVIGYMKSRAASFALVAVVALALLGSLGATTVVAAMGHSALATALGSLSSVFLEEAGSIVFLTAVLTVLFHVLPQVPVRFRDSLAGAITAAVLMSLLRRGFGWTVAWLGGYSAYGVAGALLVLLAWIHLTSIVVYFGAEIVRAASELRGEGRPDDGGARGDEASSRV
jgi:membrane protein